MADTKISALTAASAAAGANEIPINEAGTTKKITVAQLEAFAFTSPVFAAGSTSAGSAPKLTSGTVMTSAEAGAIEYTTNVPYFTPNTGNRAVLQCAHVAVVDSDKTGTNGTAVQNIFPAAFDTLTVEGSTTYLWELFLDADNGATTTTKALAFDAGSCTYTSFRYWATSQNVAINTTGTTQSSVHVNTAAVTVVLATGTTAWYIYAKGIMRVNAGGTFIPQFKYSADPTGTVLIRKDSYMTLTPLGTNTLASVGAWA